MGSALNAVAGQRRIRAKYFILNLAQGPSITIWDGFNVFQVSILLALQLAHLKAESRDRPSAGGRARDSRAKKLPLLPNGDGPSGAFASQALHRCDATLRL